MFIQTGKGVQQIQGSGHVNLRHFIGIEHPSTENHIASFQDLMKTENIRVPHMHDILFGRGAGINQHPGNVHHRDIIRRKKLSYVHAKAPEKKRIISQIVHSIQSRSPPGRFLQKNADTELWECVPLEQARKKTGQALREDAPQLKENKVVKDCDSSTTSTTEKTAREDISILSLEQSTLDYSHRISSDHAQVILNHIHQQKESIELAIRTLEDEIMVQSTVQPLFTQNVTYSPSPPPTINDLLMMDAMASMNNASPLSLSEVGLGMLGGLVSPLSIAEEQPAIVPQSSGKRKKRSFSDLGSLSKNDMASFKKCRQSK